MPVYTVECANPLHARRAKETLEQERGWNGGYTALHVNSPEEVEQQRRQDWQASAVKRALEGK